mgnify:CR=1 FL=1
MNEKCCTTICDKPADTRVFWPGKSPPPLMCKSCAERAVGVGNAMGCCVHTEPMTTTPPAREEGKE